MKVDQWKIGYMRNLLEGKVNRASARVGDDLERITSPEQFDEKITDTATLN